MPDGAPPTLRRVPNGYRVRPYVGARIATPPYRLLFVGTFGYGPNVEAARYLCSEILPELRSRMEANFCLRLVGRHCDAIIDLDGHDVEVVGYVDDITSELSEADLVVVPLLRGTGTRLKVLEAWSHQIPTVSTSVGAAGLDAADGQHLLLGDDPRSFAMACVRALVDQSLRVRLVDQGFRHLSARFSLDAVAAAVNREVESLL